MKWLIQEQWREYNYSIYTRPFKPTDKKVCNHNHLTEEYKGPAHNACNLNCCFHVIFSLVSKLFTLSKLTFNSALHRWIFLTSYEWVLILNKKAWIWSFKLHVPWAGPLYSYVKLLWLWTFLSAGLNGLVEIKQLIALLYSLNCCWVNHFIGILLGMCCLWLGLGAKTFQWCYLLYSLGVVQSKLV